MVKAIRNHLLPPAINIIILGTEPDHLRHINVTRGHLRIEFGFSLRLKVFHRLAERLRLRVKRVSCRGDPVRLACVLSLTSLRYI